jgi:hypothetical protein
MYPPLKSFFLSIDEPPKVIKQFFENELSEVYLWHLHSFVCVFYDHVLEMEQSKASIVEIVDCLNSVKAIIKGREKEKFLSLKTKSMLRKLKEDGKDQECDLFMTDVLLMYSSCSTYLEQWTKSFTEFESFDSMLLSKNSNMNWDKVEPCVKYLADKNVVIDDSKLFDQFQNLCIFVENCLLADKDQFWNKLLAHERWTKYFESCKTLEYFTELLKIAQFYFSIMSHNANVERIFSLMQSQWSKDRDNLLVNSVNAILTVQYNYNHLSCREFYDMIKNDATCLKKVKSSAKYANSESSE